MSFVGSLQFEERNMILFPLSIAVATPVTSISLPLLPPLITSVISASVTSPIMARKWKLTLATVFCKTNLLVTA